MDAVTYAGANLMSTCRGRHLAGVYSNETSYDVELLHSPGHMKPAAFPQQRKHIQQRYQKPRTKACSLFFFYFKYTIHHPFNGWFMIAHKWLHPVAQ